MCRHGQGAGDRDEPLYPGNAQQAQEHMTWDINHFILVRNTEEDHFNGEIKHFPKVKLSRTPVPCDVDQAQQYTRGTEQTQGQDSPLLLSQEWSCSPKSHICCETVSAPGIPPLNGWAEEKAPPPGEAGQVRLHPDDMGMKDTKVRTILGKKHHKKGVHTLSSFSNTGMNFVDPDCNEEDQHSAVEKRYQQAHKFQQVQEIKHKKLMNPNGGQKQEYQAQGDYDNHCSYSEDKDQKARRTEKTDT